MTCYVAMAAVEIEMAEMPIGFVCTRGHAATYGNLVHIHFSSCCQDDVTVCRIILTYHSRQVITQISDR